MPEPVAPYFDTPERAERAALIAHLINNTDLVPGVRGPAGAGKTRFAAYLVDALSAFGRPVLVDAGAAVDLPGDIAHAVGVTDASWPAGVVDAVDDQGLIIIVDQADQLGEAQCLALSEIHEFGARLVFLHRDDASAPTGDWTVQAVDLPPFTEAQAREFLLASGYVAAPPWTDQQWHQAWAQTGGQPGSLLALAATGGPRPSAAANAWKWALGGGAALLVVLVLSQQERINGWFAPPAPLPAPTAATDAPDEDVADSAANSIPIPPLPASAPEDKSPKGAAEPSPRAAVSQPPAESPAIDSPETADGSKAAQALPDSAIDPMASIARPLPPDAVIDRPSGVLGGSLEPPVESEQPPLPTPAPVVMPEPEAPAENAAVPPAPVKPIPPPASAPEAVVRPVPAKPAPLQSPGVAEPDRVRSPKPARPPVVKAPSGARDMAWLRSRNAGHYTLQLLGARDRTAIDAYVRRHGLNGNYVVFTRDLGGKPWYSLIYGDYPSRDAAVKAQAALPAGVRKKDVWPRTFASVWAQL